MPAVNLSPILNAWQGFTSSGIPLSGGFITTYAAGTSTPLLTYTDSGGTIANTNPIQLDSAGRPPSEIWLQNALAYKLVVTDSSGSNPLTYDNVTAPVAASVSATSYTTITNTGGFTAQLNTGGGFAGYRFNDQTGARKGDMILWGSSSSPTWGMTAGYLGINTPVGVGFSIGTGDAVKFSIDPATNVITAQGIPVTRVKTATTSRSSTIVKADDPHLIAPLAVGTYTIDMFLPIWATTGGGAGIAFSFGFTGTVTSSSWSGAGAINSTATTAGGTASALIGTANGLSYPTIAVGTSVFICDWFRVTGVVTVSVAGNLSLQWCQNTSSGNATNIGIGAWMSCTKVA